MDKLIQEIIEEKQLRELQKIAKNDQKDLRSLATELIERINNSQNVTLKIKEND